MQGGALSYTVQIRVSDGQRPGNHVVRLEFIDPHGKTSQLWTQNVLCPNGVREGTLDLALNETSGRWRIRATEVASGRQAERQFVVLERGGN
jgi:hypothetical protein